MSLIHPTAVIDPQASLASTVSVGPYCVVGADVVLDDHVQLISHVSIGGKTHVGRGTVIYPFASLGHVPQDLKYQGEDSVLHIGSDNVIREHVTMNPGTAGGGMITKVGSQSLFMVGCHIAHDCYVGDHAIIANNATLGGHVVVGDHVLVGGLAAIHQFVRIGDYAVIGGALGVERDVIPFGAVTGQRGALNGLNWVGLRRQGFALDDIQALRQVYHQLFGSQKVGEIQERLASIPEALGKKPCVQRLLEFLQGPTKRRFCLPEQNHD